MPRGTCLAWVRGNHKRGYGQMKVNGRTRSIHRLAWELARGPIPLGLFVCHRCDNPPCFRLSHLFLGTHQDNMKDMRKKNRQALGDKNGSVTHPQRRPYGVRHGRAKVAEKDVLDIRAQYAGGARLKILAARYNVSPSTILSIAHGMTWTHLPFVKCYRYQVTS